MEEEPDVEEGEFVPDQQEENLAMDPDSEEKGEGDWMDLVGSLDEGRKGLPWVFGSDQSGITEKGIEDGECTPDQEENKFMDPSNFCYIDEKMDYLLGHLRDKFDRELSTENLGTMFGGYGSFLDYEPSSPSILVEPSSTEGGVKTSLFGGGGKGLMNFGEKGQGELLVGNQDKGRKGLAIVSEIDQVGRMEKEIRSEFVLNKEENPAMRAVDEHRDGNRVHHSESQLAPAESPRTILEMMTSFPILGGHLLSPLPESILQLKRKEPQENAPLPGLSKCNILDRKAPSSSIPVELSSPHGRVKTSLIVGGAKGRVDSGEKGQGDLMLPVAYSDEGRMGLAVVLGKEKDTEDNNLSMHPVDDHRDVTEEHPPGTLHTPTESPGTIIQIMTTLHIPGGQLLSPLHDSLLHLKKREPRENPPLPRLNKFCNPKAKTTEALDAPYHMLVQSSNGDIVGNSGQYSKSKRKKKADQDDYRPSKKSNKEGAIGNLHPNLGMDGRHFQSGYPKESFRTSNVETNDAVAVSSKKRKMCSDFENDRSSSPEKRWKQSSSFPRQKYLDSRRSVKTKVSSLRGSSHFKGNLQHVPHQQDKRAFRHSLSNRVGRTEVAFGRGKSQQLLPSKNEQELQTRDRKVIPKSITRGGCPTDATEVTKESDVHPRQHSPNHPDALSPMRNDGNPAATKVLEEATSLKHCPMRNDGNPAATKVLEEATALKHFADRLQNNGSELETTDLYFQAALKFLQVAFLLQPPSFENAQHDDASQSMEMYSKAARLCKFCAHKYEKFNQFAAAALAYKCVEVSHMKIAYYKHNNATKYQRELQTALQMVKTHSALDKAHLGKGSSSPQVARSNIIATHHCQIVLRLLNYTNGMNCSFEATRSSQNALAATIAILGPDGHACISSVKRVINSNFHDVERFIGMGVFEMRFESASSGGSTPVLFSGHDLGLVQKTRCAHR